jgi:hypothetical protein
MQAKSNRDYRSSFKTLESVPIDLHILSTKIALWSNPHLSSIPSLMWRLARPPLVHGQLAM